MQQDLQEALTRSERVAFLALPAVIVCAWSFFALLEIAWFLFWLWLLLWILDVL